MTASQRLSLFEQALNSLGLADPVLLIAYRPYGPVLKRWHIFTPYGEVLHQCQCLEAAHRHASSVVRCSDQYAGVVVLAQ